MTNEIHPTRQSVRLYVGGMQCTPRCCVELLGQSFGEPQPYSVLAAPELFSALQLQGPAILLSSHHHASNPAARSS
jgi:hypothetical protein